MICELAGKTAQDAVRELADAMVSHRFVSNAEALVAAAMERESVLSTAMGNGLAFPHVRGVEGGGLTLALGTSRDGVAFGPGNGEKAHIIFFSVIPVAVSAFYLRLMGGLMDAFCKKENRDAIIASKSSSDLWKNLMKATRHTIR